MKKTAVAVLCALVAVVSIFSSYLIIKITEEKEPISVEAVYQMAKNSGYEGTLADFINEFKGAVGNDGRGILSATVNSEGHLIITYTDNTTVDAGIVSTDSVTLNQVVSNKAVNTALSSTVSLYAKLDDGQYASGSGVVYKLDRNTGDAYIITNYHVVCVDSETQRISNDIRIYFAGLEYPMYAIPVKYVGGSASYDIAVLKVEKNAFVKAIDAQAAVLGNSELISVADVVISVGNANGDGTSVTFGHVNIESENRYVNIGAAGGSVFMRVIRTDAAINKGNSGGGLYNGAGALIGIVTAKDQSVSADNVAYAIPINVAVSVAENIIHYCDGTNAVNGKIIKLGISLEVKGASVVYDEVSGEKIKVEAIAVKSVEENSPAARAGLRVGDVIKSVSVDGKSVTVTRDYHAPELTIDARIGSTIAYTVLRSGVELTVYINVPSILTDIK